MTRRLRHELEDLLRRIHILEGFAIVFNNLDEAIRIIRASDGKADAAPKLIDRFGLTEIQADAVLETKLYRLGKLEIKDILDELKAKRDAGRRDRGACSPTSRPAGRSIRDELKQIAKTYGDARRTRIEGPDQAVEFREEDYIVDEDAWVIVTRDGWIKRQKSFTDVASIRVRDDDRVGWVYRSPGPADDHLLHRSGHGLHPPGQRHPADDRPRRADPDAVRLRGQRARSSASSATTPAACPTPPTSRRRTARRRRPRGYLNARLRGATASANGHANGRRPVGRRRPTRSP